MKTKFYNQLGLDDLIKSIVRIVPSDYFKIAVIRAVFINDVASDWKLLMGKCEVYHENMEIDDIEIIYSDYAFVCKVLIEFNINSFLSSIENEGFRLSDKNNFMIKADNENVYWDEEVIPSHATASKFPARQYSSSINSRSYFNETILLGFEMPFHLSSGNYIKEFLEMSSFHGDSDARKGELSIVIPDPRGKILTKNGKLSIICKDVDVCLVG